jgi:hypothetical protein
LWQVELILQWSPEQISGRLKDEFPDDESHALRCHCASDRAALHDPYYEWSHLKGGKLRHCTLTPEQADIMQPAIANHRKAKKLLQAWEAQTLHLIELKAPK